MIAYAQIALDTNPFLLKFLLLISLSHLRTKKIQKKIKHKIVLPFSVKISFILEFNFRARILLILFKKKIICRKKMRKNTFLSVSCLFVQNSDELFSNLPKFEQKE